MEKEKGGEESVLGNLILGENRLFGKMGFDLNCILLLLLFGFEF
jgi:hypothetical protein